MTRSAVFSRVLLLKTVFPRSAFRRVAFFLAATAFLAVPGIAGAAAPDEYPPPWPSADVTFTVPYSPGSEMEALFSLVRRGFEPHSGRKLVARNVTGRAGADAWARIVDDAPDGSVLTAVAIPDVFLRALQPDSGVSPDSLAVCHVIAYMPCVLWTAGQGAIDSLDAFAEIAVEGSGGLLVSGAGSFSIGQVAARTMDRELGVRTTYIPYSDTVTAAKAALDGKTHAFWGYSVPVIVEGAPADAFKPLAVASGERMPSLPDVPTFRELGIDFTLGMYIGVAVPLDTPKITCEEIDEFFVEFAASPGFQAGAVKAGFVPQTLDTASLPVFFTEMRASALKMAENNGLFQR